MNKQFLNISIISLLCAATATMCMDDGSSSTSSSSESLFSRGRGEFTEKDFAKRRKAEKKENRRVKKEEKRYNDSDFILPKIQHTVNKKSFDNACRAQDTNLFSEHFAVLDPLNSVLYRKGMVEVVDDEGKRVALINGNSPTSIRKVSKDARSEHQKAHFNSMLGILERTPINEPNPVNSDSYIPILIHESKN